MPPKIIRQDVTKSKRDAIVNPTDPHGAHDGGTDAAIRAAAGEALYRARAEVCAGDDGAIGDASED